MMAIKGFCTLSAALFLCATLSPSAHGAVVNSPEARIDQLRQDFNRVYSLGSADALAGLIAENAVWMPPEEPAVIGRDAIRTRYAAQFADIRSNFTLEPGEIRVSANMAWLRGEYERADTAADGSFTVIRGKYLMTFSRDTGDWKITTDMWNSDETPPRLDAHVALNGFRALTEWKLSDAAGVLKVLASAPEVKSGNWNNMFGLMSSVENAGLLANAIWFMKPDGSYYTVEKGFITDANLSQRSYYPHLINGESVLGTLVISYSTGKRSIIVAEPVFDGRSHFVGAVGVSYSVDQLSQELDAQTELPASLVFYALDLNGQTALHRNPALMFEYPSDMGSPSLSSAVAQMLSNESGMVTYVFPSGVQKKILFERSSVLGWVFALGFSAPAIA